MDQTLQGKLNRLAKWRLVFAGWQLGTRGKEDPECQALRDHREVTIMLRAEVNAMTALLMRKGVFDGQEFANQLADEADHLSAQYEKRFPGFKAADHGIEIDATKANETMRGWKP